MPISSIESEMESLCLHSFKGGSPDMGRLSVITQKSPGRTKDLKGIFVILIDSTMSTSFDMTNSQPGNASHLHNKKKGILFLLRILKKTLLQ